MYDEQIYSKLNDLMTEKRAMSKSYAHDEDDEALKIDELNKYRSDMKIKYYQSILHPESHVSKIPSKIPIDSAVAPLKWQFNITPNIGGKFALIIDPFYNSGYLYQSGSVDGVGGSGTLTSLAFNQDANIIDQWRLVSSSLILKYYGNFNQMSGYFVAATSSNVTAATQTTYLTFNNVEDLTNRQVLKAIDGCKLIYSPMDEKATEFHTQTTYSAGTHPCRWQYLFIVIGDAFPNSSCIRVDFFRNIEYTSVPAFKEYINQSKEKPCDYSIPPIQTNVTIAPIDFRGGGKQNTSVINSLADSLISLGKNAFGNYITDLANPFIVGGFK